jgi:hypothetical protein
VLRPRLGDHDDLDARVERDAVLRGEVITIADLRVAGPGFRASIILATRWMSRSWQSGRNFRNRSGGSEPACRVPRAACRSPRAACRAPRAACRVPRAACRVPLAGDRVPLAAHRRLSPLTAHRSPLASRRRRSPPLAARSSPRSIAVHRALLLGHSHAQPAHPCAAPRTGTRRAPDRRCPCERPPHR